MKYLEIMNLLTPILMVILILIISININIIVLRKLNFLTYPYSGLDWSQVIWSGSYLLSQTIIYLSLVYPTIQTFRYYKSTNINFIDLIKSTLPHFSIFVLTVFIISLIFFFVSQLVLLVFPGEKNADKEIKSGNIPLSILTSFIMIGFSLFFYMFSITILENQIPISFIIR